MFLSLGTCSLAGQTWKEIKHCVEVQRCLKQGGRKPDGWNRENKREEEWSVEEMADAIVWKAAGRIVVFALR